MRAMIGWAAAAALLVATPALADIKAGADAWTRGDYKTAVEQWRGPAIAGDPDAQFNMGQAYKLGRGVPTDLSQAEQWYAKAAARGHLMAADAYGLTLFQEGKRAAALPWLEKSAARDERRAELILGTMLFNGDGAPKDEVRAYALISRSSQQGLTQGSTTLAQMDGYLTPDQRERGLALASEIQSRAKAAELADTAGERGRGAAAGVGADSAVDSSPPALASAAPTSSRGRHGASMVQASSASRPPVESPPPTATHPAALRPAPVAANILPRPAPVVASALPRPAPATHMSSGGRWRVQLGAFRAPGAAQALWKDIGGRVGGQPTYTKAGAVTRLQAGPFASKADAERACHAAGVSCVVVPG